VSDTTGVTLRVAMILFGDITYDSRVQREASALAGAGHAVTIFCLDGAPQTAGVVGDGVTIQVVTIGGRRGVPHGSSPFLARGGIGRIVARVSWLVAYVRNIVRWGRAIRRTGGTFDVWHAHDFTGLLAARVARPSGAGLVYDLHDLHLETDTGERLPGPMRRLLRWYERRLIRSADLVVTVNHGLAAYLEHHYQPRKLAIVHNCVPRWTAPEPPPSHIRNALGIGEDVPIVLYHGLLDDGRGIDTLVAAMREPGLERVHLVLLGFGPRRESLLEQSRIPPLAGRMHLLPAVPPAELLPWVASADVGVVPNEPRNLNDRLSTPNKLFESIGAGLPVVSSDFAERRRIIADDPAGPLGAVCDPTDPAALGRAIRSIVGLDGPARRALKARCVVAARDRWNWETEAGVLVDAYRAIATARSHQGRR
jgi:glycosyltransferase involved in cell wall biosynthesis